MQSEAALVEAKEKISELEKAMEEEKASNSALLTDLTEANTDIINLKDDHANKLNELSVTFFSALVFNDAVLQKLSDEKDAFHDKSEADALKAWTDKTSDLEWKYLWDLGYEEVKARKVEQEREEELAKDRAEFERVVNEDKTKVSVSEE